MTMKKCLQFQGLVIVLLLLTGLSAPLSAQEGDTRVMAGNIIDHDVYDARGELIGEVDDIIIRRNGTTKKLTVEFGGFLDIGDKLVALPFRRFDYENGAISLDITEGDSTRAGN